MKGLTEETLERIDAYLTGRMSPIEKSQFKVEIAYDSELKQEVDFQSAVINSLKSFRKAELKAKLSSIQVTSKAWWQAKWAITSAAATLMIGAIGTLFYLYYQNDNNPYANTINHRTTINFTPISNIYESENEVNTEEIAVENETVTSSSAVVAHNANTLTNKVNYGDVNAPGLKINTDDENGVKTNSNSGISNIKGVEFISSSTASDVDIEIENSKSKKLYYKFYDNKLYLFGTFKGTYEVLQFNTNFGKEFYFKYNNKYFTIKQGVVNKELLEEIVDSGLINKLQEAEKK